MIACVVVAMTAASFGAPSKKKSAPAKKKPAAKQAAVEKATKKPSKKTTLPTGMTLFDTEAAQGKNRKDRGYPTVAAASDGKHLWLGRDGGVRRYDAETGQWVFFEIDSSKCPGYDVVNVASDPPYVWVRRTSTGSLCRLNPETKEWKPLDHWTVLQHTGPGYPFEADKDLYYVASTGGPDWEGVSIIDKESGEWMKLLPTKPPQSMHVAKDYIWVGVPEGILRIDKITEKYRYYQPTEHGGGALVKDIISAPWGLAFATLIDRTSILGDEMKIDRDTIRVRMKEDGEWREYSRKNREELEKDLENGKVKVRTIKTRPGLLLLQNGKWKLLTSKDGLPADDVIDLDKDERFMYISTAKGISALELKSLKAPVLNREILARLRQTRRMIVGDKYIWAFTNRGLYRVTKRLLFSEPRPAECGSKCKDDQ